MYTGEKKQIRRLRSGQFEIIIMAISVAVSYFALLIISMDPRTNAHGGMTTGAIVLILLAFFLLSTAVAVVSVIAGIGGGVIFTPVMLAFTGVNSLIVRGTGIIVAMSSGAVATGVFTKKGLSNYRLNLVMTLSQGIGALVGATLAVLMAVGAGVAGEGLLRLGLGLILMALAIFFLSGGKKLDFPKVERVDRFTKLLRLDSRYYDESEGKMCEYKVKRAHLGIFLLFVIGVLGGFFGMGGGWAITPTLNLGMGMPLRAAAASSNVILGVGGCVSVWPYIYAGGVIPLFVLPWLVGQVAGGFVGAQMLVKIKVDIVRMILIGIMIFTSFTLIVRGLEMAGVVGKVPDLVHVLVFGAVMLGVVMALIRKREGKRNV